MLTMNPSILLFDEPFNGLSPKYQSLIAELLQELKVSGKTMIIFSHHYEQIQEVIQRVLVFSEEHTLTGDFSKEEWEGNTEF